MALTSEQKNELRETNQQFKTKGEEIERLKAERVALKARLNELKSFKSENA